MRLFRNILTMIQLKQIIGTYYYYFRKHGIDRSLRLKAKIMYD